MKYSLLCQKGDLSVLTSHKLEKTEEGSHFFNLIEYFRGEKRLRCIKAKNFSSRNGELIESNLQDGAHTICLQKVNGNLYEANHRLGDKVWTVEILRNGEERVFPFLPWGFSELGSVAFDFALGGELEDEITAYHLFDGEDFSQDSFFVRFKKGLLLSGMDPKGQLGVTGYFFHRNPLGQQYDCFELILDPDDGQVLAEILPERGMVFRETDNPDQLSRLEEMTIKKIERKQEVRQRPRKVRESHKDWKFEVWTKDVGDHPRGKIFLFDFWRVAPARSRMRAEFRTRLAEELGRRNLELYWIDNLLGHSFVGPENQSQSSEIFSLDAVRRTVLEMVSKLCLAKDKSWTFLALDESAWLSLEILKELDRENALILLNPGNGKFQTWLKSQAWFSEGLVLPGDLPKLSASDLIREYRGNVFSIGSSNLEGVSENWFFNFEEHVSSQMIEIEAFSYFAPKVLPKEIWDKIESWCA